MFCTLFKIFAVAIGYQTFAFSDPMPQAMIDKMAGIYAISLKSLDIQPQQDQKASESALAYKTSLRRAPQGRFSRTHQITVNPELFSLSLASAQDDNLEAELLSSMIKRTRALAAINGGFYAYDYHAIPALGETLSAVLTKLFHFHNLYEAVPLGITRTQNGLLENIHPSQALPIAAMGWSEDGQMNHIGPIGITWIVHTPLGDVHLEARGLVQDPTPQYNIFLPVTDPITKVVYFNHHLEITDGRLTQETFYPFETPIPSLPNTLVYSLKRNTTWLPQTPLGEGAPLRLEHYFYSTNYQVPDASWNQADFILSGNTPLVKDGLALPSFHIGQDWFAQDRMSRVAACLTYDHQWLFMVVDVFDQGASLKELAHFLVNEGCETALNLDGGGSAALFIGNHFSNKLSSVHGVNFIGELERPISNGIMIKKRHL